MRGVTKCQPVELGETLPPGHCEERWFCQEKKTWLEITGGHQPCALARQLHLLEQLLLLLHPHPQLQLLAVGLHRLQGLCSDMNIHSLKRFFG